jgi:hypothetical protein|tara:strand:+ start:326 stop:535 length:210 start_codon:yes stop_codon:yes gene_type:complete
MSVFNEQRSFSEQKRRMEQPRIPSDTPKVNLNHLIKRVKEEEKKTKRSNLAISAATLSAVAIFGIILTL